MRLCTQDDACVRISPDDHSLYSNDTSVDVWLAKVDEAPQFSLINYPISPLLSLGPTWWPPANVVPLTAPGDVSLQLNSVRMPIADVEDYSWLEGPVLPLDLSPTFNENKHDAQALSPQSSYLASSQSSDLSSLRSSCTPSSLPIFPLPTPIYPLPPQIASSTGPVRTTKSFIPPEYMTHFRVVQPSITSPSQIHTKRTPSIILCQCENKTAKPKRHWDTSCPFNPTPEMVQCIDCGEVFKHRLDNYKRHLSEAHGGHYVRRRRGR